MVVSRGLRNLCVGEFQERTGRPGPAGADSGGRTGGDRAGRHRCTGSRRAAHTPARGGGRGGGADRNAAIHAGIRISQTDIIYHPRTGVSKLRTFRDGRYRAYFTLVYQCGLRLSEALHVRPKDIDGERLVLRVTHTKGGDAPASTAICAHSSGAKRTGLKV